MSNNFWRVCPRSLEYFPEKECPLGKTGAGLKGDQSKALCQWYINSKQDHYCYWSWIRRNSDVGGGFKPQLTQQVANLLKMSPSKINVVYREAIQKLESLEEYQALKDLI